MIPAPIPLPEGYTVDEISVKLDPDHGPHVSMKWSTPRGTKYCFMPHREWWTVIGDSVWWTDALTQLELAVRSTPERRSAS